MTNPRNLASWAQENLNEIGRDLLLTRERAGQTVPIIARMLGFPRNYLNKIERGAQRTTPEKYAALVNVLRAYGAEVTHPYLKACAAVWSDPQLGK